LADQAKYGIVLVGMMPSPYADIRTGEQVRRKMPNIRDVARRAGVSTVTVSRVLNDSGAVSEDTRKKVEDAIEELSYVPNLLARGLRSNRTDTLALVIPDITNPFWTTVARGVEDKAIENGFSVILCNTDEDPEKQKSYIEILVSKRVDGVVIAPVNRDVSALSSFSGHGIAYVLIDARIEGIDTDLVLGDSIGGAYGLVSHLAGLGHRRIAIIAGPEQAPTAQDRLSGYLQALQEWAIPVDDELIRHGSFDQDSGYELTLELLQLGQRPTALFAGNNVMGLGALIALRDHGVRVPEDMALVAFDELPQLSVLHPFLTVADQQPYQMGTIATQLVLERLMGQRQERREIMLETKLILRESSGGRITPES
jgi:LacI family transcriptional regulator